MYLVKCAMSVQNFYQFMTDNNNNEWIDLQAFKTFLDQNACPTDLKKEFRTFNIKREKGVCSRLTNNKWEIDETSVLSYIFHHRDESLNCEKIARHITKTILKSGLPTESRLNLYTKIAEQQFKETFLDHYFKVDFSCLNIQSLSDFDINIYKPLFNSEQWRNICIFEHHFGIFTKKKLKSLSTTEADAERWHFFNLCLNTQSISSQLGHLCKNTIIDRNERCHATYLKDGMQIQAGFSHVPQIIDEDLHSTLFAEFGVNIKLVSINHENSQTENSIRVMVEYSLITDDYIFNKIREILEEKHQVKCESVILLPKGTISAYEGAAFIARFALHDDFLDGKFDTQKWIPDVDHDVPPIGEKCLTCFPACLPRPLDIKTFDILEEWVIAVPLPIQILLESLISKRTFDRANDKEKFLRKKLTRLFTLYDAGLNCSNKCYTGVLQVANTDELLMHYKNVSTVFDVTSNAGLTKSLKHAERQLRSCTMDDYQYWENFIKGTYLHYNTSSGIVSAAVPLQGNPSFILIDNLVTLSSRRDPKPGESRTGSLCTLQITIQALPKDSITAEGFHAASCNGGDPCNCKERMTPTKGDFDNFFLHLMPDETGVWSRALALMTWGNPLIWHEIESSDFGLHINSSNNLSATADEIPEVVLLPLSDCHQDSPVEDNGAVLNEPELYDILESSQDTRKSEDDADYAFFEQDFAPLNDTLDHEEFIKGIQEGSTHMSQLCMDDDSEIISGFHSKTTEQKNCHKLSNILAQAQVTLDGVQYDLHNKAEQCEAHPIEAATLDDLEKSLQEMSLDADQLQEPSHMLHFPAVGEETMEQSFADMSIHADSTENSQPVDFTGHDQLSNNCAASAAQTSAPSLFQCHQYRPNDEYITKHLTTMGLDTDIDKLREILFDLRRKLNGSQVNSNNCQRILFGGDHKLGDNMFKLMSENAVFEEFIPVPPVLHLLKSRVNTLFSAYNDAGIIEILMSMKDDMKTREWSHLISLDHIDVAVKNVRRIGIAIQLAFFTLFSYSLDAEQSKQFYEQMRSGDPVKAKEQWESAYDKFIQEQTSRNGTFELHADMLFHCNIVTALRLAERMGGADGFHLLLAATKKSLSWSFVNGASSYAPFCVQLLYEYYRAGQFHKSQIHAMWSTPVKKGTVNHGPDSRREIFHQDATPAIRTSGSEAAVLTRLAKVSHFSEVHDIQSFMRKGLSGSTQSPREEHLSWQLTKNDLSHIYRAADTVLRAFLKHNVCGREDPSPYNLYKEEKGPVLLSEVLLDRHSVPNVGKYLMTRYAVQKNMFGFEKADIPSKDSVIGPKLLVNRATQNKSVTTKRGNVAVKESSSKTDKNQQKKERMEKQDIKKIKALNSAMNTCQAMVNPDGCKRDSRKASGMSSALMTIVKQCLSDDSSTAEEIETFILLNSNKLPDRVTSSKLVVIEFAGMKFKVKPKSGPDYLMQLKTRCFDQILSQCKNVGTLVVVEEKYQFTPDKLKFQTRLKRQSKRGTSISHLKSQQQMIGENIFDCDAVTQTLEGKKAVSVYLAEHLHELPVFTCAEVIVDSEFVLSGCDCQDRTNCVCPAKYAVPLIKGNQGVENMSVKQRKGEAEMACADWLFTATQDGTLSDGESAVCFVTSGDIDTVVILIFLVSRWWPRHHNRKFQNDLFVVLSKKSGRDVYNVTGIVEVLEKRYSENIGLVTAVSLCIAGNDFLPGFRFKSHTKILLTVLQNANLREHLLLSNEITTSLNRKAFEDLVKAIYAKKPLTPMSTYEEIRYSTICPTKQSSTSSKLCVLPPGSWMPPLSAIQRLAELVDIQIQYLLTAGDHTAPLPDIAGCSCIAFDENSTVYDFGPDVHAQTLDQLMPDFSRSNMSFMAGKPSKRAASTPQKQRKKRQPNRSTPKKVKPM